MMAMCSGRAKAAMDRATLFHAGGGIGRCGHTSTFERTFIRQQGEITAIYCSRLQVMLWRLLPRFRLPLVDCFLLPRCWGQGAFAPTRPRSSWQTIQINAGGPSTDLQAVHKGGVFTPAVESVDAACASGSISIVHDVDNVLQGVRQNQNHGAWF